MRRVGTFSAVVFALLLVFAIVPPAMASDHVISTSTTLTHDLTGGVVINADNVVLDCAGHSITGPGWGDGVLVEPPGEGLISGVTVRNCVLQGFVRGIVAARSTDATLESNTVQASASGVQVESSSGFSVTGNVVDAAGWGVILFNGDDGVVSGNTVTIDGYDWSIGFGLEQGSERNAVSDNVAVAVGESVFQGSMFNLSEGSNGNLLVDNRAEGGGHGFYLTGVSNNTLRDNVSEQSVGGFGIDNSSQANLLEDNSALFYLGGGFGLSDWDEDETPTSGNILRSNVAVAGDASAAASGFGAFPGVEQTVFEDNTSMGRGFYLEGAVDNSLVGNVVEDAPEAAFVLVGGAHHNTLIGNTARQAGSGFAVDYSDGVHLEDNVVSDGRSHGIRVDYSNGTVITGNVTSNNPVDGILVWFSSDTQVSENTASGNGFSGIAVWQSSGSLVWENQTDDNGQHGVFGYVTDGSLSRLWENTGCGNGIADGADYSQVFGYEEPAKWTDNTFCTFLIQGGPLVVDQDTTLSGDFFGSIDIAADGVKLNCAGYSIVNPDGSPFGVTVIGRTGVTVENCDISGFTEGLSLTSTSDSTVAGNTFSDNVQSVVLYLDATNNTVKDNSITDSDIGVWVVDGSAGNTIKGNVMSGNGVGILVGGSDGNVIKNNVASNNSTDGILVVDSKDTQIGENTASGNGFSGIAVFRSSGSLVWENQVDDNGDHGVFAAVTDGSLSHFWENTGCGNGIADGADYSQVFPFGFAPAEWTENTFCTVLIDPGP
jgi:parallel beta-helix repeat protein